MNDDELKDRVFKFFQDWIDLNFHKKYNLMNSFGSPSWKDQLDEAIREFGIKWDQTLNVIGVVRIEHHLKIPPRKDRIRFEDPFVHAPTGRRNLELTREQATKILTLGIP